MSVNVIWDESSLLMQIENGWSWEAFQTAVVQLFMEVESRPTPVHLIVEFLAEAWPDDTAFERWKAFFAQLPVNIGQTVFVIGKPLSGSFVESVYRRLRSEVDYARWNLNYTDLMEDARRLSAVIGKQWYPVIP